MIRDDITSATIAPVYYAFNHMDIGTASLLFFAAQLLAMYGFGFVAFKERATWVKIFSFFLAIAGLYTVFSFSIEKFAILVASMAVLNGFASGSEVSLSKKLSVRYSPLYLLLLSWIAIIATNAPLAFLVEGFRLPTFNSAWLIQLGYTVVGLVGFWAIMEGLKHIDTSVAGLLGLMEIIIAICFGIFVFQESLTARIIVGGSLIIIAAGLPHFIKNTRYDLQHSQI